MTAVTVYGSLAQISFDGEVWTMSGEGPLRPIVVDAATRREAVSDFSELWRSQYAEGESMTAASIAAEEV